MLFRAVAPVKYACGAIIFDDTIAAHLQSDSAAVGQAQRRFEAFGQALFEVVEIRAGRTGDCQLGIRWLLARLRVNRFVAHLDAVNHHVNVVFLGLLQCRQVVKFVSLAVDAKTHITLGLHLGKHIQKLALLLTRHRCQNHQPRIGG